MNVAFFGTSDRSINILNSLNENFDLVLCVTKNDTVVGRKKEIRETQVKTWTKKNNTPYLTISSAKKEKNNIIKTLKEHKVDIAVVADFSFIIPEEIINTPQYKMINIHFSLLPKYRGASPVQHAIINMETETGITYYELDKGMDTGKIIYQSKFKLQGNETSQSLFKELFEKASLEIPNVINKYVSKKYISVIQIEDEATYTRSQTNPKVTSILKEDAKINWQETVEQIDAKIRAYFPWPIAWTTLKEVSNNEKLEYMQKEGSLRNSKKDRLKLKMYSVTIKNGKLSPTLIQLEGKQKQTWEDFLNGYFD